MAVDLEALDAELNSTTLALLGDTITYTPSGGATLTLKAIADQGDDIERVSGSGVTRGDCAVEIPKSVVAEPAGTAIVTVPDRPGEQFHPKDWKLDETGMNWLVVLKKKPA